MDTNTLEKVAGLLEKWENSSISETLSILNTLAKAGLESKGVGVVEEIPCDPCKTPAEAAAYLGVTVRTLRDKLTPRHNIKSTGQGRGRLYRLSELNRVIDERENG